MLRILKSGLWTSIQDKGRHHNRTYGVPVSGYMDSYSAQFANLILGNNKDAAVMEITMSGPELQFLSPTTIAIVGAQMQPLLNGCPVQHNTAVKVKVEDILKLHHAQQGMRSYLAVKGGFDTLLILGSRSFYASVTEQSNLRKGDVVPYQSMPNNLSPTLSRLKFKDDFMQQSEIKVYPGPEYHMLNQNLKSKLLKRKFTISKLNNRMAYQFEEIISNQLDTILTGPVMPGTVQLTPSGNLIALMRDCQTTGGYPRIFQLSQNGINILAQKQAGNSIKFRLIE